MNNTDEFLVLSFNKTKKSIKLGKNNLSIIVYNSVTFKTSCSWQKLYNYTSEQKIFGAFYILSLTAGQKCHDWTYNS